MLALGLSGFFAGRRNGRIDNFLMTLSGNSRAGAYFLAAILAVGVAGIAGHGAGCVIRVADFGIFMIAGLGNFPHTADIVDGIAGLGGLRFGVGAVGVVQLGGGDGDGHCIIPVRIILIGRGFRAKFTILNIFAGSVAGADVCAALGGVDGTASRQAAVYIHLGILQIRIGTVIGFAGSIGNRLELARTPDKVIGVPFVAVINVDILTIGDRQVSTLSNAHFDTCQQCGILVDGDLSRLNVNRDVVGDGEYIACGVDTHARQLQRKGVQFRLAVHSQKQTIRLFIVVFGEAAGGYFEHAVVANKIDGGGICGTHCINAAENLLVGARIKSQGNFNVLNEILREWKNIMVHVRGSTTAAEVCDLIELIYGCAGFSQHRTAAGDKAPCIEISAVLHRDRAVIRHFNIAIIAHRTTLLTAASCKISAAQADGTVDGDGSTFAHRQRPERLRRRCCADCRRRICI